MSNLADVATLTSGTLTAFPINSVNALLKVTKLDSATAQAHLRDMFIHPYHHIFHDNTLFTYAIPSGVSTITTVLNGIVGNVAALYFVVRASTVELGWTNYYQLASFSIADNTGTNIVGGQVDRCCLLFVHSLCTLLNKEWCKIPRILSVVLLITRRIFIATLSVGISSAPFLTVSASVAENL